MSVEIIVVGAAVVSAEIALIVTMRQATKEIRAFRKEMPRMLGAGMGISLLLEAVRTFKGGQNATGNSGSTGVNSVQK